MVNACPPSAVVPIKFCSFRKEQKSGFFDFQFVCPSWREAESVNTRPGGPTRASARHPKDVLRMSFGCNFVPGSHASRGETL